MTVFYNPQTQSLQKIEWDSLDDSESPPAHGEDRQGLHLRMPRRRASLIDLFDGRHQFKGEAT
jgi:hypothetical protein